MMVSANAGTVPIVSRAMSEFSAESSIPTIHDLSYNPASAQTAS